MYAASMSIEIVVRRRYTDLNLLCDISGTV